MPLFILCLPPHLAVSLCHLTTPTPYSVYFYECLQYLMEAKKAQQSLESTYKQLDIVSLTQAVLYIPNNDNKTYFINPWWEF